MTDKEAFEFYLKEHGMFFSDFWAAGNEDFNLQIEPHNCQSGRWYTATWKTKDGQKRYVTAQWHRLVWERIIKQFLADERKEASETPTR